MAYFVTGFALLLHLYFWGLGLAWWVTPRRWQSVWPLWIPVAGFVLQSAVVWAGAFTSGMAVKEYAYFAHLLPAFLAVTALVRGGAAAMGSSLRRHLPLVGAMMLAGTLLLLPMALGSRELTTVSLGSCDAADYAAGTRTFLEFARGDRQGFLGLTEVVHLGNCDNFYDFWLRLNHFTPSAVCALAAAVFRLDLHEVTGVMTVLFLTALVPSTYFLARAGVGLRRGPSTLAAWVATVSPVSTYAVAHVAMAQVLAAAAIALLTGVGLLLWRRAQVGRCGAWGAALVVVFSLLLGAYNFILLVAWTPAVAAVGWDFSRKGGVGNALRWGCAFFAPLLLAGVFWWDRSGGIAERFRLFQEVDFGWKIPAVTPEGWFGLVAGADLSALPWGPRVAAWAALAGLWGWAWRRARWPQRRLMVLLPLPVIIGYAFLQVRGAWHGTNASYDAYKILAVFFPVLICASAPLWQFTRPTSGWSPRAGLITSFLVLSGAGLWPVLAGLRHPSLTVTRETAELRQLEERADVSGINLQIDDFWTRLWANAFLLRKAQYFSSPTYEGRRKTELKGSHDLQGRPITGASSDCWTSVNRQFTLSPAGQLQVGWSEGWYQGERSHRGTRYWRWSAGKASFRIESSQNGKGRLEVEVRALDPRPVHLVINGQRVATLAATEQFQRFRVDQLEIPAGVSLWSLESDRPALVPGGFDRRELAFAVSYFALERMRN